MKIAPFNFVMICHAAMRERVGHYNQMANKVDFEFSIGPYEGIYRWPMQGVGQAVLHMPREIKAEIHSRHRSHGTHSADTTALWIIEPTPQEAMRLYLLRNDWVGQWHYDSWR